MKLAGVLVGMLLAACGSSSSGGTDPSASGGSGQAGSPATGLGGSSSVGGASGAGGASCTLTGSYHLALTRDAAMPGSCSGSSPSTAELQISGDASSGFVVRAGLCAAAGGALVFSTCSSNAVGCMVAATCDDPCTGARKHNFTLQLSGNAIAGSDAVDVLQDPGPGCTENDDVAGTRQ